LYCNRLLGVTCHRSQLCAIPVPVPVPVCTQYTHTYSNLSSVIPVKINRYRSKLNDTVVPTGTVPSVQFPLVHVYTHTCLSCSRRYRATRVYSNRSYTGCIQQFTRTILYKYVPCTHVCAHTPVHLHTRRMNATKDPH
jgi:hypothetical protein